MSLQNILLQVSSELGIAVTNSSELAYWTRRINEAARELYESTDLPGCLRENTFNVDTEAQTASMVSLPWYVDQIRGIKFSNTTGAKIPVNDMRPRYFFGRGWGENAFSVPMRIVRENMMLGRDIINASALIFTLPKAEEIDIMIQVVGETDLSSKSSESVVIYAGSLQGQTVGNYAEVPVNIEKSSLNSYDIAITDIEENVLGAIPNSELTPRYKWLELTDANVSSDIVNNYGSNSAVDILYKQRFTPFRGQYDEFPCANCDRAIFYKVVEYYEQQDRGNETRAMLFHKKCEEILNNLMKDVDAGRDLEINFAPSGFVDVQNCRNHRY